MSLSGSRVVPCRQPVRICEGPKRTPVTQLPTSATLPLSQIVGNGEAAVVDTWWQTETGAHSEATPALDRQRTLHTWGEVGRVDGAGLGAVRYES